MIISNKAIESAIKSFVLQHLFFNNDIFITYDKEIIS